MPKGKETELIYKKDFDVGKIRNLLGLDGSSSTLLPKQKVRLANLLLREEKLSAEDIRKLDMQVVALVESDNKYIEYQCPEHGKWRFEKFAPGMYACAHHDHDGGSCGVWTESLPSRGIRPPV